ncbi:MAG: hypothetical protein WCK05_12455, partial [Planctomycetota bacterium]
PSPCCRVNVGPGQGWPGTGVPETPAGATDYGFEDQGSPTATYHGDADFEDCIVRIYNNNPDQAFVVWGSAAASNSIWANGTRLLQIGPISGVQNPPKVIPLPFARTNYGYNAKIPGVGSDSTIVAMDYPKMVANTPFDDVRTTIDNHPELALRHMGKVNVLRNDGGVWRAQINQVYPDISERRKLWGNE